MSARDEHSAVRIEPAGSAREFACARELLGEYAAQLGVDLCFQGFAAELERLASIYAEPRGCLLLAWQGTQAVGCVAVRGLTDTDCEMKRLYLKAAARGHGHGRRLVLELLDRARALGYRRMLLDTLESMTAARELYRSLGFRECAAYYPNPLPGARYLALDLTGP